MANANIKIEIDGVQYAVKEIESLKKATEGAAQATEELADAQKESADAAKEQEEETGFLQDRYNGLKDTVSKLRADFKLATKGISTFFTTGTKGAKALKIAFASTGIGLLVVAIASLIDYFKDTEEGSRVLTVAFESVGVIVNKLIDFFAEIPAKIKSVFEDPVESIKGFATTIQTFVADKISQLLEGFGLLGEALSDLFSGEFSSAADKAKEGFLKIGDSALALNPATAVLYQLGDVIINDVVPAVTEAVTAVNDLVLAERGLRDLNQELIVSNAQLTKQLETEQKIAEDTTLTYQERKDALDQVNEAQIQLAENAAKQAQAEEDLIRQQLALADSYEEQEELQTALAEAVANRISRETELETKKLEAGKLSRELEQEELDRQQTINDTIQQLRLENIEDEREAARESLRIAEETAIKELERLKATDEEIQALRDQFAESRRQQEKEFADEDAELLQEKLEREEQAAEFLRQQSLTAQQAEIDILRQKYDEQIELAGENSDLAQQLIEQREQAIAEIEDKYRKEKVKKDRTAQQEAINSGIELAAKGIQAIIALNQAAAGDSEAEQKKAFERNKKLQIALATIQTAQAVTAALTAGGNPIKLATGAQFVEAAIVAAQGLAQIVSIKNTEFGGGGSVTTPTQPPAFNGQAALDTFNQGITQNQDPGEAITPGQTGQQSEPIRAYVIATEVTSQQEANQEIENLARL